MKRRAILTLVLTLACVGRLLADDPDPCLRPGEELRYWVSFAIVPGAGQITVSAAAAAPNRLKITTTTSTRRLARLLLPFDATAESLYDTTTGRLLSLHDWSNTRGKHAEHIVHFDYVHREASYAQVGATKPRQIPMPEGSPSDLITALLQTRSWDIKPGEARDALVLFDDEFYELTIHAVRYETINTPLGTFRTLVLEPRMEKTPPKGMFRKGSTVRVWIAQDGRRLPVKFEVVFNIGTGTATLEHYDPGPEPAAATAPSNPASASTADGATPAGSAVPPALPNASHSGP